MHSGKLTIPFQTFISHWSSEQIKDAISRCTFDYGVDHWALGVIAYWLAFGTHPFCYRCTLAELNPTERGRWRSAVLERLFGAHGLPNRQVRMPSGGISQWP